MQKQLTRPNNLTFNAFSAEPTIQERSFDVLTAVAILCLGSSLVDGDPDLRELKTFEREFRRQFVLSKKLSKEILKSALRTLVTKDNQNALDRACVTLCTYLTESQRERIIEIIQMIIVADQRVKENEVLYLDYVATQLEIVPSIIHRALSDSPLKLRDSIN